MSFLRRLLRAALATEIEQPYEGAKTNKPLMLPASYERGVIPYAFNGRVYPVERQSAEPYPLASASSRLRRRKVVVTERFTTWGE
jgi:hypothetical protein